MTARDHHHHLHLTDRDGVTRAVSLTAPTTIGRVGTDIVLDDAAVSREHCRLVPTPDGLVVEDLGSRNGTLVDGRRIDGPRTLRPGDVVTVGDTTLVVLATEDAAAALDAAAVRTGRRGTVRVVARPGTRGEAAAAGVRAAADAVWPRLAELVSAGATVTPTIRLIEPYVDAGTGAAVVDGSSVDAERHEIWTVVSAHAAADEPAHALALLVAAMLDADARLTFLLEGYGLHLAGIGDTDDLVRAGGVRPPGRCEGDHRLAAVTSFVRHLLRRGGEDAFRELVRDCPPGGLDERIQRTYGSGLGTLVQRWMQAVEQGGVDVPTGRFLRLSVRHLRPYWRSQVESFALMLLGLAFTMAFPFVTKSLFDDAIPSGEFDRVVVLLGILGGAFVVSLVAGLRQVYVSAWISGSVIRDLRSSMFARLQQLPQQWYDRHDQGDVLSRLFTDVEMVESGLTQVLSNGIMQILTLAVSSVVMLTVDWRLGAIVIVSAPVVGLVYRTMGNGARTRSVALQEESSGQLGVVSENLAAQQVVKLFGLAGREQQRFDLASGRVLRAERRLTMFGGLFGLSVNMIVVVMRLVVLGLGAWFILEGDLTIGGLVAFLSVMGEVIGPVTSLTTLGQGVQRSSGALVRIDEVLEAPVEEERPDARVLPRLQGEIRLEHVSFSYAPDQPVLQDVSVTIPAGAKVAFVGPSGSGKSTILRLLMRLYDPTEGAVTFDGVDVRDATLRSLREQLGVVLQDPLLFNTTVRENIALGAPGASADAVLAASRGAEVDAFIGALPSGYDTLVGDRGGMLSGGQRQRVSIARAIVRDPAVLLLDEATSALDPRTERQIGETLDRLGDGRTIVSITHRLTSVVGYDRIFVLADGRVVEQGTHAGLLGAGGLYARLWAEQMGEQADVMREDDDPDRPPARARRVEHATGVVRALRGTVA